MQRIMTNLVTSRARIMVVLRSILAGLIVIMGLARLRVVILLLGSSIGYMQRDILQQYLLAKALVSGINPYMPLDKLAGIFMGSTSYLQHPSPYPPIVGVLFSPLARLSVNNFIIIWSIFELFCLIGTAILLSIIIKERPEWILIILLFSAMLAWNLVMIELFYGQTSILLTFLLTAALLSLRKNKRILAGVLVGVTAAIKIITWPVMIYFMFKKDWRAFFSSVITAIGLNLFAILWMGIGPVLDYYQNVTREVWNYYHAIIYNLSIWSIGYRIFDGTNTARLDNYFNAPPLINLPSIAMIVSIVLVGAFLAIGMFWAVKSKDVNSAFSILICIIIAISPTSWVHYYVMFVISLLLLWQFLVKLSFPPWKTLIFFSLVLMYFFGNSIIENTIIYLNGGLAALQANHYEITFWTSLLIYVPLVELLILCALIWQTSKDIDSSQIGPGIVEPRISAA